MPKIFAMDIGAGTADILYFDSGKVFENNIKLIVPTSASVVAGRVKALEEDVSFSGSTIGGGPFASAVMKQLKKGYRVRMTRAAAFSIRNNIAEVKEKGIEIGGRIPGACFTLEELNLKRYDRLLEYSGESLKGADALCIALQDHGAAPYGVSDREFRFDNYVEGFKDGRSLERLAYLNGNIPKKFLRMRSAYKSARSFAPEGAILIMDTAPAAILGAMADLPPGNRDKPVVFINFGNIHTLVTCIKSGEVLSIFEHHTHLIKLDMPKFKNMLSRMLEGTLPREEVFEDRGNGALTYEKVNFRDVARIVVTGPNRRLASALALPVHYAAPGGDMMITGPIGLICAAYTGFRLGGREDIQNALLCL